jgi:hypothetical protein
VTKSKPLCSYSEKVPLLFTATKAKKFQATVKFFLNRLSSSLQEKTSIGGGGSGRFRQLAQCRRMGQCVECRAVKARSSASNSAPLQASRTPKRWAYSETGGPMRGDQV